MVVDAIVDQERRRVNEKAHTVNEVSFVNVLHF